MKKIRSLLWMLCLSAAFLCGCSKVQETAGNTEPAATPEATILDETSAFSVFSEYEAFPQRQNTWYTKNNLIVHATGGIDGLSYTNSKDAMTQSLKKGYRLIEVDFNYTTDNKLVCVHNWSDAFYSLKEAPDFETFMNIRIQGKYTPACAEDIINYMKKHKDLFIVIDSKDDNLSAVIQTLYDIAKESEIMDRFIVQLYQPGEKANIEQIYDFPEENYLFTCYKFSTDPMKIIPVCYDENINVVTIKTEALSEEALAFFMSKNIYVYEHTVNRPDKAQNRINLGVWGLYTDFITKDSLVFRK